MQHINLSGEVGLDITLSDIKQKFEALGNEKDVLLNIDSVGGSVREGFLLYDYLRTSGKTLYCNVTGGCHSMAVILLLAAPAQNRTANPLSTAVLHDVSGYSIGSADDLERDAEIMRGERNRILNIYADRTKLTFEDAERIMLEEKERTADELLNWGFITSINKYNTNKMNTKKVLDEFAKFYNRIRGIVNYAFTDAAGAVLFETDREDSELNLGDTASPDGTFTLQDGRVVTIADGVITGIVAAPAEDETDLAAENEALRSENEVLRSENKELAEALNSAITEYERLENSYRARPASTHVPANRATQPKAVGENLPDKDAIKKEVKEKLNAMRNSALPLTKRGS